MMYNYHIHQLLKAIVDNVPPGGEIEISAATVSLLLNSGHNSSQQIAAMWKALGLPKKITGDGAKSWLDEYEKIAKERSKKVYRMRGEKNAIKHR